MAKELVKPTMAAVIPTDTDCHRLRSINRTLDGIVVFCKQNPTGRLGLWTAASSRH